MAEITTDVRVLTSEIIKRINDETRRLRLLEQAIDRSETSLASLESQYNTQLQGINSKIEDMTKILRMISDKIIGMESGISKLAQEMEKRVTKNDLKEIEAYLELISPINSAFVTKEQVERILEEKIGKKV